MTNIKKFMDGVLGYVEVSSLLAKKAVDEVSVHRQAQKRAGDLRGPLLKQMLDVGVVAPHQKEAADAMLASHAETLNLLKAAVEKISELRQSGSPATLGKAVTEKEAGVGSGGGTPPPGSPVPGTENYDSLSDPVVGRRTSFKKASDVALARALDQPAGR